MSRTENEITGIVHSDSSIAPVGLHEDGLDFRLIFESLPGRYLVVTSDLLIVAVSNAYTFAVNINKADIIGRFFYDVFTDQTDTHSAEMCSQLKASIERALENRSADTVALHKFQFRREQSGINAGEGWWHLIHSPVLNNSGAVGYIIQQLDDVTELVELKQKNVKNEKLLSQQLATNAKQQQLTKQLSFQASHDELTGLVNRQELSRRLVLTLAHSKNNGCKNALLYLDLDRFKMVNDTCGHAVGDELLRRLASLMKCCLRERDTLARIGGDEFAVLLGDCSLEQAKAIAEKLRDAIEKYRFIWNEKIFSVGVSIGLAPIHNGENVVWDHINLMRAADSACLTAKHNGGNCVHSHEEWDEEIRACRESVDWVQRLQQALAENKFYLMLQPIVPAKPYRLKKKEYPLGGEFLLRLEDEENCLVMPDIFIPIAERYQMMHLIDRWVVTAAFSGIKKLSQRDLPKRYCLNVSGQSLNSIGFLDFVMDELEKSGVDGAFVCIEITEATAISNLNLAVEFITELKKRGVQFALDEFGNGLSSLAYLRILSVDYLKISGRYVKSILDEPLDLAVVETINRVGKMLGIKTIAESVESAAVLAKLKSINVDFLQGFHIEKPKRYLCAENGL